MMTLGYIVVLVIFAFCVLNFILATVAEIARWRRRRR